VEFVVLVADRVNRDCVIVRAELDDTLLLLVWLVVLSFLPFLLLVPIPNLLPKLPLPTDPNPDPDPSDGDVPCPGNGTGLVLALS
jgi:hypothetical protein